MLKRPFALVPALAGCGGGGGSASSSHVAAGVTTSTGVVVGVCLTGLSAAISTELARNDLATSEPTAVAHQVAAAIGVGRVKAPAVTKGF